jgi:hypothetical protein
MRCSPAAKRFAQLLDFRPLAGLESPRGILSGKNKAGLACLRYVPPVFGCAARLFLVVSAVMR